MIDEPDELRAWDSMSARQRNDAVGRLIGADPLTQCFITVGKLELATPHGGDALEEAEALAGYARGIGWEEFRSRHGLEDAQRSSVRAIVKRWHLRYSDTPGGGWEVIENLERRGFRVTVQSRVKGWWTVILENDRGNRAATTIAETMAEAACLAASRVLEPATDRRGA